MPFLSPNQQHQSTDDSLVYTIALLEKAFTQRMTLLFVNHKQPIVAQPASLEDGCVADCYCKVAVCLSSRKGVCLLERVA